MRLHFILPVFFACICAVSCSKNDDSNQNTSGDITGRWELRYTFKGLSKPDTAAPGNGTLYEFRNNRYKNYQNHVLYDSGTYRYEESLDSMNGVPPGRIVLQSSEEMKFDYSLYGDVLHLTPLVFTTDGFSLWYVKIGD